MFPETVNHLDLLCWLFTSFLSTWQSVGFAAPAPPHTWFISMLASAAWSPRRTPVSIPAEMHCGTRCLICTLLCCRIAFDCFDEWKADCSRVDLTVSACFLCPVIYVFLYDLISHHESQRGTTAAPEIRPFNFIAAFAFVSTILSSSIRECWDEKKTWENLMGRKGYGCSSFEMQQHPSVTLWHQEGEKVELSHHLMGFHSHWSPSTVQLKQAGLCSSQGKVSPCDFWLQRHILNLIASHAGAWGLYLK